MLEFARLSGHAPSVMALPAEEMDIDRGFDFAFSINVMEHVGDVGKVLQNVVAALRPGACYRFTCPNYLFPYEPHFNIPTLFSKQLTGLVFRPTLARNQRVSDPVGLWASLNWISVPMISRFVRRTSVAKARFNRAILRDTLQRVVADQQFASRRSAWTQRIIHLLVFWLTRVASIRTALAVANYRLCGPYQNLMASLAGHKEVFWLSHQRHPRHTIVASRLRGISIFNGRRQGLGWFY